MGGRGAAAVRLMSIMVPEVVEEARLRRGDAEGEGRRRGVELEAAAAAAAAGGGGHGDGGGVDGRWTEQAGGR